MELMVETCRTGATASSEILLICGEMAFDVKGATREHHESERNKKCLFQYKITFESSIVLNLGG